MNIDKLDRLIQTIAATPRDLLEEGALGLSGQALRALGYEKVRIPCYDRLRWRDGWQHDSGRLIGRSLDPVNSFDDAEAVLPRKWWVASIARQYLGNREAGPSSLVWAHVVFDISDHSVFGIGATWGAAVTICALRAYRAELVGFTVTAMQER